MYDDYKVRKDGKYNGSIKCPICDEKFEWIEKENAHVFVLQKSGIEEIKTNGLFQSNNCYGVMPKQNTGEVEFEISVVAECPTCEHKIQFLDRARYRRR